MTKKLDSYIDATVTEMFQALQKDLHDFAKYMESADEDGTYVLLASLGSMCKLMNGYTMFAMGGALIGTDLEKTLQEGLQLFLHDQKAAAERGVKLAKDQISMAKKTEDEVTAKLFAMAKKAAH